MQKPCGQVRVAIPHMDRSSRCKRTQTAADRGITVEDTIPVRITGDGARRLADLHSIVRDLQWVQVACVLAIKHMDDKASAIVVEGLQTSALVRYCRTFESAPGAQFSLVLDMLETLPAELQQAHHEFCVLQKLYIAHSGDDLLWNVPTAHVEKDTVTGEQRVCRLSVEHCTMVAPSRDLLAELYELVSRLLLIVQDRLEQDKARALAIMKARVLPKRETVQEPAADLQPAAA